jgi:hypothetical protein
MKRKAEANFWRCNFTKEIRIGYWKDNGTFETVRTVKVKGREVTGYEANAAYRIVERMNETVARC